MKIRLPTVMTAILLGSGALAAEDVPIPSASPDARASPAAADKGPVEDLPPVYSEVLEKLRNRKFRDNDADTVGLKFGGAEANEWPPIQIAGLRETKKGPVIVLVGDGREYFAGDLVQGALLLSITDGVALFEFHGEKKSFAVEAEVTDITIRVIRQIEGEWAVFFEDEKRPTYAGEVFKGFKVIEVSPKKVIVERGKDRRELVPKAKAVDVTAIPFRGILQVGKDRFAVVAGRPEPVRVGDTIDGAKILEINEHAVVFEVNGEKKTVTVR